MPANDEQPTAAAFARVEEQLKNVQMDLAEIKTTLHESLSSNTAAHDQFWRTITEETRQRIESDTTLTLQCRALEAEIQAVRTQSKIIGAVLLVAWGVVQWVVSTGLRLAGR